jgi:hypothetical protein
MFESCRPDFSFLCTTSTSSAAKRQDVITPVLAKILKTAYHDTMLVVHWLRSTEFRGSLFIQRFTKRVQRQSLVKSSLRQARGVANYNRLFLARY